MNSGRPITLNSKMEILRMSRNSPGQQIGLFFITGDSISGFISEHISLTPKIRNVKILSEFHKQRHI